MARVPRLLDVSVPLRQGLPTYPDNPPFQLQPVLAQAEPGIEMYCLPLPVTGGDGAPARVILKR